MPNTIFTKIISKEIPAEIVYEDDTVLAFLDIKPINVGHTLIVPKKPFRNILDGDPEVLAHMIKVAKRIAVALREVTKCDGINILMNNEPAAGQEVFHAHLHVIPRLENDHAYKPANHMQYNKENGVEVAAALHNALH